MFSPINKTILHHKININHLLFNNKNVYLSSSPKQRLTRISQIGFKTQNIINTNKLTFIPQQPLQFTNGKSLVYESKKGIIPSFKRYFGYYFSISAFGVLIHLNPFKYVFPAAIPILYVLEVILIKLLFKRYQWNQQIVHRIYLLESGSTTQIHYADKKRRQLFGQPLIRTYYNTIFSDPIEKQKQQVMPNSHPFPSKVNQFEKSTFGWFWCKYFSNGDNYLILPKEYQLMRKDVIVQLFKGKTIKNP